MVCLDCLEQVSGVGSCGLGEVHAGDDGTHAEERGVEPEEWKCGQVGLAGLDVEHAAEGITLGKEIALRVEGTLGWPCGTAGEEDPGRAAIFVRGCGTGGKFVGGANAWEKPAHTEHPANLWAPAEKFAGE